MPKVRIDPRTGKIVTGPTPIRRVVPCAPPPIAPPQFSMDLLMQMAQLIGKTIAEELKNVKGSYQGMITKEEEQENADFNVSIDIDESIIDVGLGTEDELQLGEGSSSLSDEEVCNDSNLSKSKAKLAKLKGK